MRSMKLNLLKKLKVGHSQQERVIRLNASDGFIPSSPPPPPPPPPPSPPEPPLTPEQQPQSRVEVIEVSELMKDLEDEYEEEEMEFFSDDDDKENIKNENFSKLKPKIESFLDSRSAPLSEIDPNLISAFQRILMEHKVQEPGMMTSAEIAEKEEEDDQEPPVKARKIEGKIDPLLDFEEKCPPGGSDSVILYTTGLRSVRKTFEDCQNMRLLLKNFRVLFFERDISMHSEYKEELWEILGEKMLPPRLFIKGRYIGGVEQVFALHEQGKLKALLDDIPLDFDQETCGFCGGMRFILCFRCNGSRKVHVLDKKYDDGDCGWKKCPSCNENGLIVCPLCC